MQAIVSNRSHAVFVSIVRLPPSLHLSLHNRCMSWIMSVCAAT